METKTDSNENTVLRLNGDQTKALRQLIKTAGNKGKNSKWWQDLYAPLEPIAKQLEEAKP